MPAAWWTAPRVRRPASESLLLAHSTSVPTIEQILRTNQMWLSNPLYMNDMQEMRAATSLAFLSHGSLRLRGLPCGVFKTW
jgi:hypothetical protein